MEELFTSLASNDVDDKVNALTEVWRLGELGAAEYGLDQSAAALLTDPSPKVQEYALYALGAMGSNGLAYTDHILRMLSGTPKPVKRAAIQSIGALGSEAAFCSTAVEGYLDDDDTDLVADACRCLGSLQARTAAAALVGKLSSADIEVVRAACEGLSSMDAEADAVGKLLSSKDALVRAAAARALTGMSKAERFLTLVAPLVGDSDCRARIAAADLVCSLGAKASSQVSAFGKLLGDSSPGVVAAAATVLGSIGAAAASEIVGLEEALTNTGEDKSSRSLSVAGVMPKVPATYRKPACAAAAALGALGTEAKQSSAKIAKQFRSKDWEVLVAALGALGRMASESADFETDIIDLTCQSNPMVSSAACATLGRIAAASKQTQEAASAVAQCLEDNYPVVRAAACEALGSMGSEADSHLEALKKGLSDRAETVQVEAIKAFTNLGEVGQLFSPDICRALHEGTPAVRIAAVEALSNMGERGACFRDEVEAYLEDEVVQVREAVRKALKSFESEAIEDGGAPAQATVLTYVDASKPPQPIGVLFPGQGSQYVKMLASAKDLPPVRSMLAEAKSILGYDLLDLCLHGPEDKLEKTQYCQAAVYVADLAAVELLRKDQPEKVECCQAVAGLSLGEYAALTFAGVFDFRTGLELVKLRGEAMQEAADASPQMMLSVAGLEEGVLEELCKESAGPGETCEIVNFLFKNGYVCAGDKAAVEKLEKAAAKNDRCLQAAPLKTSGAFHTGLMKPAQEKLLGALRDCLPDMKTPSCEVYMNVHGKKIAPGTAPADIINLLSDQLVSRVLWNPLVDNMIADGISEFYEVGPEKQLKAMMKRINIDMWKSMTNITV